MKNKIYLLSFIAFLILFGVASHVNAATCSELGAGGTCVPSNSCDLNQNTIPSEVASDCGFTLICCIPKQTPTGITCSGSQGGTCKQACDTASGEIAVSGSYTDCFGSNIVCCKKESATDACKAAGGGCVKVCEGEENMLEEGDDYCDKIYPDGDYMCCKSSTTPASTGSTTTIEFPNPLKYDTVEKVLTSLLNALQGVIVVISIIFIVIGAIFYITSAGNDQRMETAKKAIFASLIGLAIGIAAPTFLKEISNILGWTTDNEMVSGAPTIATIALRTLDFLLSIVGTISLIMLIVAAIMYLTAAGDEDRIDKGKKLFKYALIGITIALASLVVVKQIAGFFGG